MKEHNWLDAFLKEVKFSQWQVLDLPGEDEKLPQGYTLQQGRQLPIRPDGFAIGNGLVRAALSVRVHNNCVHTTALSTLFGPTYGHLILREPYVKGGGMYVSPYPAQDFILQISIPNGHSESLTAEAATYRFSRRLLGTAMTSTGFRNYRGELITLDFAPTEPPIPAIIRVVKIQNIGPEPIAVKIYAYLSFGCSREDAAVFDCAKVEPDVGLLAYGTALGYTALNQRLPRNLPFVLLLTAERGTSSTGIGTREDKCWEGILRNSPPKNEYVRARLFDGYVARDLGTLAPGETTVCSFFIILGESDVGLEKSLATLRSCSVEKLARDTYRHWQQWSRSPCFRSPSPKIDHLLDSLMVLERVHCEGKEGGIVAGTLNYGLGYWIRDGYYQARGLLKSGKYEEARRNLEAYRQRVQRQGLSNCYHVDGTAGDGWYNINDELASLAILMARDYYRYTKDEETLHRVLPYVKKLVEDIRLSEHYLTIGSGDETWRIAAVSDTWAETPDNAFSAALALEFAHEVLGESKYGDLAKMVRQNIKKYLLSPQGRYLHYRTPDGLTDERPITNIMTRPLVLGYADADDTAVRKGIEDAWRHNRIEDGVVKHDPLSTSFPGNAFGFMMYCLAEMDAIIASDFFWKVVQQANASGCYWEFYFTEDPNLSGERLRSWDSAVVLEGLLHYLYGISPKKNGFQVAPHLPEGVKYISVQRLKIQDNYLSMAVTKEKFALEVNGQEVLKADRLLRITKSANQWRILPIASSPPYLDVRPLIYIENTVPGSDRIELSPCFGNIQIQIGAIEYVQQENRILIRNRGTKSLQVVNNSGPGHESAVLLETGQERSFIIAKGDIKNEFYILTPHYQMVETPQPSKNYILRGRAYYHNGLPFTGSVKVEFCGQERNLGTDSLGYYECRLSMPQQRGKYPLVICIDGQRFKKLINVVEDPMEELDHIIAHQGLVRCCLLTEKSPAALRIAWEIWQEVLLAKDVSLPLVFDESETDHFHVIRVGDVPLYYEELAKYNGYSTGKIGERYVFSVPASNDVREVQPFVNALRVHWRYPTRWKGSNLVKYGKPLQGDIKVEVETEKGVAVYIGSERKRKGVLLNGGVAPTNKKKPYLSIHRQQQGCITKVVIQADGASPFTAKVRLYFPHSSIVRLGMPQYMDVKREIQQMNKRSDGTRVVTISLQPGRPLSKNRVFKRRTFREIEIEAFALLLNS